MYYICRANRIVYSAEPILASNGWVSGIIETKFDNFWKPFATCKQEGKGLTGRRLWSISTAAGRMMKLRRERLS